MILSLLSKLDNFERMVRNSFGKDITTRSGRIWAHIHFHLMDHAFLRVFWNNFYEVSDQVYRANQPSPSHLRAYKRRGIKSVLNLRGFRQHSYALFEQESCEKLEIKMFSFQLSSSSAPEASRLLELIDFLEKIPKPFVIHCKSGADRAGLVSTIYLLVYKKVPVSEAKKQLSFKYLHLDFTKTGILDYIFNVFSARLDVSKIDFVEWLRNEYNANVLNASFKQRVECKRAAIDLMEFSNAKH